MHLKYIFGLCLIRISAKMGEKWAPGLPNGTRSGSLTVSWYRSEGFPLTGLFHPWAQWDLGLDTLENSSRRAVAVAAVAAVVVVVALGGVPDTGYAFQHESYSEKRSERNTCGKLIVIAVSTSWAWFWAILKKKHFLKTISPDRLAHGWFLGNVFSYISKNIYFWKQV